MKNILFILLAFLSVTRLYAQDVIKIGIIGLDTSHSTAFTELLNGDSDDKFVKEFEVVANLPLWFKDYPVQLRTNSRIYRRGQETRCGDYIFHSGIA